MGTRLPPRPPETVVVGRVLRAHGIRGEVLVEVLSDVPNRFSPGDDLLAVGSWGRRELRIRGVRPHRSQLLVRFEGVEDRDGAMGLRGADLEIDGSRVPPAPEGCFYHFELIGCRCRDLSAGELGRVAEVLEDGGGLLLVVESESGQLLVPFAEALIVRVALEDCLIELDLPPGLLETCVSTS